MSKLKANIVSVITTIIICFATQASGIVTTYIPMKKQIDEEIITPKQIKPKKKVFSFNGFYAGIGGGIAIANAKAENTYTGVYEMPWELLSFSVSNKLTNLGKYGFGGSILTGFGRVLGESYYLGGELFANYLSPKMEALHEDIITEELILPPPDVKLTTTTQIKSKYSFGGDVRIGYLVSPKTMVYALFGIDYGKFEVNSTGKYTIFGSDVPEVGIINKFSKNKIGYIPGIGIETTFGDNDNTSLRLQYTHTFYQSFKNTVKKPLVDFEPPVDIILTTKIKPNTDVFSLILSYYFN